MLAYVDRQLERRREATERTGSRVVVEGVWSPGWNSRFSGRGVVQFERQPAPGHFSIEVSVLREILYSSAIAPGALVLIWIQYGRPAPQYLLFAGGWILVACGLWLAWGVYKMRLLRRLVRQGLSQVGA